MTQGSFATHEVLNQSPPFRDINLFAIDKPLMEAVVANGGSPAQQELSEFGQHWGSAAMAERGRLASENTPKLRTFDSRGNRRDQIEFHPAYHELMAHSAHAGVHNSTWTAEGRPAGGAENDQPARYGDDRESGRLGFADQCHPRGRAARRRGAPRLSAHRT